MSLYLVTGHSVTTGSASTADHLPTRRPRCYPSDTTDAEWQVIAPLVPAGGTHPSTGGRPVSYPRRDVVDAIRYLAHNGGVWAALPVDFPHHKLVYHYFTTWTRDGTLNRIHNSLREQVRTAEGRTAVPTAALLDSQSVRGAETVGKPSRGYDAGKKINGRKRHIAVDTCGLLLAVLITGANVQDRDAARPLLWVLHVCFPTITLTWADSGYAGKLVDWAATQLALSVQIVAKPGD